MEWQPIETAPQTGVDLLLLHWFGLREDGPLVPEAVVGHWDDHEAWWGSDLGEIAYSPTHWCALPAFPADPHG